MSEKLTSPGKFVITDADRDTCLGSDELKPCPFCGKWAMSSGMINERTGNYVHHIICSNSDCSAQVHCCMRGDKQAEARENAVGRWNRRKS